MPDRRARERPWTSVPLALWLLLASSLAAELALAWTRPPLTAHPERLAAPPSGRALTVLAFGEPAVAARLLMLWLQAQDYQPGLSLPLRELDYAVVEAWLTRMLELDPGFDYALLAASRVYGEVDDPARQRRMIAFVQRAFENAPAARWRWMAHAVYLAQHRLHDFPLALALARQLADAPGGAAIPHWARQMHIFVLEHMGELDSARVVLGGLLAGGAVTDAHERAFLTARLRDLESRSGTAPAVQVPGANGSSE